MSMTDPIADMLTRIRNASMVAHETVSMPASKLKEQLAKLLKEEGFISGIKAFLFRNKHCCPGFVIYKYQGHYELKTINGLILKENEIDERLLSPTNPSLIDFDDPKMLHSNRLKLRL